MCNPTLNSTNPDEPLSAVLIGCGPGGMSLLHVLEHCKQQLHPNSTQYKQLPQITCYERAPKAGGLWRDPPSDDVERKHPENKSVQYEELWLNATKELFEYFDYTYNEHFQQPTPQYLPRRDVWEYIMGRNNMYGELESDNVHYNHSVLNVEYSDVSCKFIVQARNDATGQVETNSFDRCVYACGSNGKPNIPTSLMDRLSSFTGKCYHSTGATENFEQDVRGKRVLMIGDSLSTEDLTLRAMKYDVEHVYFTSRSEYGSAATMGSWPEGKVTMVDGEIMDVMEDGKSFVIGWKEEEEGEEEEKPTLVENIDLVILCTGYTRNQDMLDSDLRIDQKSLFTISPDWKMKENELTEELGDVVPYAELNTVTEHVALYHGLLISNPHMMFVTEYESETPIMDLDISAWLVLSYLLGNNRMPSKEKIEKEKQISNEEAMQIPYLRNEMDETYFDAVYELCSSNPDRWKWNTTHPTNLQLSEDYSIFWVKDYARKMKLLNYPVDFGTPDKLTPTAMRFVKLLVRDDTVRTCVDQDDSGIGCTFRDFKLCDDVASLHNETPSIAFSGYWVNLVRKDENQPTKLSNLMDKATGISCLEDKEIRIP